MAIRSKPTTPEYREGFDRALRKRRKGSGICRDCHRYPCRCRGKVFDRAAAPAEHRGGRARLINRTTPTPVGKMTEGLKAATRVLGLAQSRAEREMFRSLLRTDGTVANPSEIRTAEIEVRARKGW